ncbi:MAG: SDR family oxidoreductase [Deltaproteobacteria bacterium]|nr:SDR family oxidoreductase [Deltaproteobacteria bacterium]
MSKWAKYPSLKNRSVFITGGGSGIGASIVEHFCEQGSKVGFVDIDVASSKKLVADMKAKGHIAPVFREVDLRNIAALQKAIKEISAEMGPFTILINNAAHDERHKIDDVTVEFWDDRQAVNLRHQFFTVQAIYKEMAAAGGGSIVNIGSSSWYLAQGGMPGYTTAKCAVLGLTRGFARDLGGMNIRVNHLVPGWIMTQRQIDKWLTPESEADMLKKQCLKEKVYPEDVARMALWLASDDSRMCTNQSWVVDGGWI